MSLLSDGEKALMGALTSGVQAILGGVSLDPNTKNSVAASISGALSAIENEAMSAGATIVEDSAAAISAHITGADAAVILPASTAAGQGLDPLQRVESAVGLAVENTVDFGITKVLGPLAPEAITIANALLEMLGGDAEAAIASLFHAKQSPILTTVAQVTAAVSPH